jgi:prevent-host-death family protein
MKTAGVAALKARLSRYLDAVKGGQEVVITERGRAVAKLVPLGGMERRASRRDRLIRAGLLQAGPGRIRASLLRPPRGPRLGAGVLRALLDERGEGR